MIITPRKLDITTRDVCPKPGDYVQRKNGHRTQVNHPVAHYPGFVVNTSPAAKSLGVWEVVCPGERKATVTLSVYWGGVVGGTVGDETCLWYEVPSR